MGINVKEYLQTAVLAAGLAGCATTTQTLSVEDCTNTAPPVDKEGNRLYKATCEDEGVPMDLTIICKGFKEGVGETVRCEGGIGFLFVTNEKTMIPPK